MNKRYLLVLLILIMLVFINFFMQKTTKLNITNSKLKDPIKIETDLLANKEQKENLDSIQENGYRVIENQSFEVNLNNYGEVKFLSTKFIDNGNLKLQFFIMDNNNNILYKFPSFYGNQWSELFELKAISFRDVNNDNLTDIIIIAEFMTGIGKEGAIPFPIASIYFQNNNEFIALRELDDQINHSKMNETIDMVLTFCENNPCTNIIKQTVE